MAFIDILKLCRKHIATIILLPLLSCVISVVVCWGFLPDEYSSSKQIYVLSSQDKYNYNPGTNYSNEQSELNYGINFSQQLCNDVAELVKSSKIRDAVASEVHVDSLDDFKIAVESSEKNRVITMTVTTTDPQMSAKTVESLANKTAELSKQVTDAESVNIIDETKVPKSPSGPPRVLITCVVALVALFIALIWILIRDVLDTTIKGREDLVKIIRYPLLVTNPKVKI